MKFALCLLLIIFSITSFASKETQNGGDAVICPGQKPQLYDYFELRSIQRKKLDVGPSSFSFSQKLNYVVTRLERKDQQLGEAVRKELHIFLQRYDRLPGIEFPDIKDSKDYFIPTFCELKQLAIRDERLASTGGKFYFVKQEIWDEMEIDERVGLAIHEVVYRISKKQEDSTKVRYLVGYISSTQMNNDSLEGYVKAIRAALEPQVLHQLYSSPLITIVDGYRITLGFDMLGASDISKYFYDTGMLIQGQFLGGRDSKTHLPIADQQYPTIKIGGDMQFYPNGTLKSAEVIGH